MSRLPAPTPEHESFVCSHCGATVSPPESGTELRLFALAARPLTRLPFPYRVIDGYEAKR